MMSPRWLRLCHPVSPPPHLLPRRCCILPSVAVAFVRPEPTGLHTWPTSYRIRGVTWPMPYTSCNCS
jgi:hypothetical protein